MSEKNDWKVFKQCLPIGLGRLERIENIVGEGNPDVNYCINGVEGWIEMKSPIEPKKTSSKLLTKHTHKLLQTQKNWFLKQRNAGGRGYILIATDKRWMLIDGCKYGDFVNDKTVSELLEIASWSVNRGKVSLEDWVKLRVILSNEIFSKAVLFKMEELEKIESEEPTVHQDADDLLCALLDNLGYDKITEVYNKINKWYE